MKLQRQHFLLSHFKILSVDPAGVRTRDLLHDSPMLSYMYMAHVTLKCLSYLPPSNFLFSEKAVNTNGIRLLTIHTYTHIRN